MFILYYYNYAIFNFNIRLSFVDTLFPVNRPHPCKPAVWNDYYYEIIKIGFPIKLPACVVENGSDLHINERQKIRHYRIRSIKEIARFACKWRYYSDVIHSFD